MFILNTENYFQHFNSCRIFVKSYAFTYSFHDINVMRLHNVIIKRKYNFIKKKDKNLEEHEEILGKPKK